MQPERNKNTSLSEDTKIVRPKIFDTTDEDLATTDDIDFNCGSFHREGHHNPEPQRITTSSTGPDYAAMLAEALVCPTDQIPPAPACLSVINGEQDQPLTTLGNISLVIGKAKARKTFVVSFAVAAAVAERIILNRIKGSLPAGQDKVLFFDTEQSRYHVLKVVCRICALVGLKAPGNLLVYSLRKRSPDERLGMIDYAINHMTGIGMVVIDGVRDLQVDPILDANQASKIITHLLRWTTDFNIHIMTVLHQNKTDGNARGHLGSELTNKAETVITVTKDHTDKDVSIVAPGESRDKDFEPFAFSINEQGLPVIVEDWQHDQRPVSRKEANANAPAAATHTITPTNLTTDQHGGILRRAFAGVKADKYNVTCHRIKAAGEYFGFKFGDNKAKEFMTYYTDTGLLLKVGQTYALNLPTVDTTNSVPEESGLV